MPSGLWHFALSVGVCSLADNNNNNNNNTYGSNLEEFEFSGGGGGQKPPIRGLCVACDAHFQTQLNYSSQKLCVAKPLVVPHLDGLCLRLDSCGFVRGSG